MKFTVDRIENNIAVLENRDTLEMINVNTSLLPSDIYEGCILLYDNNKYIKLVDEEVERRKKIEERFKRLRSN